MLTREEWQEMCSMDIRQADREQLADISEIQIDSSKTVPDRIQDYLRQTGNPFFVKAGDYVLKFQYADCQEGLEERMAEYLAKMVQLRYPDS